MITIYTDGSYVGNKRIGGWAAIIVDGDKENVISGGTFHSKENGENITAQRMEVQAVLEGLFTLSKPSDVLIVTDSSYVCDTINKQWLNKWIAEADFTKKHFDLWRMIYNLLNIHNVKIERVKAHAGHHYNERCDTLAKEAAKRQLSKSTYKNANQDILNPTKKAKRPSKKSKNGFYAVAKGRKVGIFKTWNECKSQVDKYKGAKFKKFDTKEDAESFIEIYK